MHINIEKASAAYNSFFANAADKTAKKDAGNIVSDCFKSAAEQVEAAGYFVYDKDSKLANDSKDGKSSNTQNDSCDNVLKLLNNAIDTLKNLVTDEDYSKLAELGITADKDDLGTIVTVYERIQIQLAAYTDADISSLNISSNKIDKVIKSPNVANSLKMAEGVGDIDDNAKEYILKNDMQPTVENIYKAVHTNEENAGSFNNPKMTSEQWQQLKPQVEKFLKKNGIEADDEAMEGAKWLIEKDISLTVDNLIKYTKLTEIEEADTRDIEAIKANMVLAELFGMGAGNGYMTTGWINKEKAEDAVETINGAGEQTVRYIVNHNLTLNVANLEKYKDVEAYGETEGGETENHSVRVLVEAKAVMTMEGAILMQKMGIDVTYTDVEIMVNEIKERHAEYTSAFFENQDNVKTAALMSVMDIMSRMTTIPVKSIGVVAEGEDSFTVRNIYDEGIRLKESYEKAGETYEAVGTQIRTDLGDSISKAFENVDVLIEEAGLEADWYTRRAVRILGYNSMEVTSENIIMVAEKSSEVDRVIKNITPKTASYLIENGINPLDEDIEELNNKLEKINAQIGADENEQYSKYLWKLEKSGAVTEEQRQAFIELYRTLKTISKSDTRAIGAVVNEGARLTLGNLLSAEKSRKKYGMNVKVDEETGYYQGKLIKNKLSDILENINFNERNINENNIGQKTVSELWESCITSENVQRGNQLDGQYEAYLYREMEKTVKASEDVIYSIMESRQALNMTNISAMAGLISSESESRMLLKEKIKSRNKIIENFNGEEEANEAYEELDKEADELFGKVLSEGELDYLKYKGLCDMTGFMVNAARNKSYNIPMDIDGRDVMVKVRFSHDAESKASINVTLTDDRLGHIQAELKAATDSVSGIIICSSENVSYHLRDNENVFAKKLGIHTEFVITTAKDVATDVNSEPSEHTDKELYEMAKSFLGALKVLGEMPINKVD